MTADRAPLSGDEVGRLRDLLAGTTEVLPYKAGDQVYRYCGKAVRSVVVTVNPLNWNTPEKLAAYCATRGCSCSMKVGDLPVRYRITQAELKQEAARALPGLLATIEQQAEALGLLRSALERTEANFIRAVNGKPVRDMAETLAENRAALHPAPSVQPDPREA